MAGSVLPGRAPGARHLPVLLVVVDDLLNLLERAPQVAGPLAEIASMSAGLGVHLLAGTQEAGSKRGTRRTGRRKQLHLSHRLSQQFGQRSVASCRHEGRRCGAT